VDGLGRIGSAPARVVLGILLLVSAGCRDRRSERSGAEAALALAPADASALLTIDLAAARQLGWVQRALGSAKTREALGPLAGLEPCGYTLDGLRRSSFAFAAGSDPGRALVVLEGPGFGKRRSLSCAADRLGTDLERGRVGGRPSASPRGASSTFVRLDAERLAYVGGDWVEALGERLSGRGSSALDEGFAKAAAARSPPEGALLWYAGPLPPSVALPDPALDEALDEQLVGLVFALRPPPRAAGDGARIELELGFASDAAALGIAALVEIAKLEASAVTREGPWVRVEWQLDGARIDALMAEIDAPALLAR
jgi:hypothetical protein